MFIEYDLCPADDIADLRLALAPVDCPSPARKGVDSGSANE
jgi:hypothetical protein